MPERRLLSRTASRSSSSTTHRTKGGSDSSLEFGAYSLSPATRFSTIQVITGWCPSVGGLHSPATRFGTVEALTDWWPTVGGLQSPTTRFETVKARTGWGPTVEAYSCPRHGFGRLGRNRLYVREVIKDPLARNAKFELLCERPDTDNGACCQPDNVERTRLPNACNYR